MLPEQPEVVWEDGRRVNLDGASPAEMQESQGEDLAQQTLALTSRYYEADSYALMLVVQI